MNNYEIYDPSKGVFSDLAVVQAKNSRSALAKYLGHSDFKRSGDYDVIWQVYPVRKSHTGNWVKDGRACWYK